MITILLALAAALVAFAPDTLARPRASWRRSLAAFALHAAATGLIASCLVAATGRVVFSGAVAVLLVALLAIVSNAKQESLHEPFVFTDLSLFSQLFAHPRLYLPFLSAGKVVALVIGGVVFVVAYLAETPLSSRPLASAALLAAVCGIACPLIAARLPLSLDPPKDQRRHGFFAAFVAYLVNGLRPATFRAVRRALDTNWFAIARAPAHRPDVIVIQSESFFDARKLDPAIRKPLLAQFDRACREAMLHGELDVPAWGANTMRTEFAALTGIREASLGYARFYPYAFVRRAGASLASWLKGAGYRTLAIHPYHADFFGRERAYRHLGFELFMDIGAFADAPRAGAYIADEAVTDAILRTLKQGDEPKFIFAVTMENHGPLHLESVNDGDGTAFHDLGDAPELRELTAYLRHLVHADDMIGRLLGYLRGCGRDTVVCFYGDHVPAMSRVYSHLGRKPSKSDFFVWKNFGAPSRKTGNLRADELGLAVIAAMSGATTGTRAGWHSPTPRREPAELIHEQ
jgi:hypothetical protein